MRLAPRTEVRVIPDLLHWRDEHLKRPNLTVWVCADPRTDCDRTPTHDP
jgi:hypothetical protein